ncbi:MAG: Trm112 family protein [Gemmatimonadales bacterium]|nr:Trm112 family protein [Gemmatimonadota bacterium]MCL4213371.1 Trm112 family protein [Gemmatimonadales bacterium]
MALPARIRELLACPKCRGALEEAVDGGALHCTSCSLSYPVRDGIPVLLVEQAEPLAR